MILLNIRIVLARLLLAFKALLRDPLPAFPPPRGGLFCLLVSLGSCSELKFWSHTHDRRIEPDATYVPAAWFSGSYSTSSCLCFLMCKINNSPCLIELLSVLLSSVRDM